MKKVLKMAAIVAMSISMAICGSGEASAAENKEVINIEPAYVVVDDENVKMEITSVSKEILNGGSETDYKVNFTVTNKSEDYDANISVSVGACSVGQYTVQFGNMNTDTKAGKINDTACYMASTAYSEGIEHIETLEDLLQFEAQAKVTMSSYDGESSTTADSYAVDISLADYEADLAAAGDEASSDAEPAGDSASADTETAANGDAGAGEEAPADSDTGSGGEGASDISSREVTLPAREYSTLEAGSSGDDVTTLQQALVNQGFIDVSTFGFYGDITVAGVKAFQESVGLEATGIADSQTQQKLFGDEGEVITITLTGTSETDHMKVDGLFVDESYIDEDNENLSMVYLFYTVFTDDENLEVDSVNSELTVNGTNIYTSEHYWKSCMYMENYYYSSYLEDVYIGESLKVAETFKIPKGDLTEGRTITFSSSNIPGSDKISLLTDDIVVCDSAEKIARIIDPDGYADMKYKLADADEETKAKVKSAIDGYYWTFYVNNISYKIEFYSDSTYELTTMLGTTNGTYAIKNAYIVLKNSTTGAINNAPYSWGESDIKLELADAFDVKEG